MTLRSANWKRNATLSFHIAQLGGQVKKDTYQSHGLCLVMGRSALGDAFQIYFAILQKKKKKFIHIFWKNF